MAETERLAIEAENEVSRLRGEPPAHHVPTEEDEDEEMEAQREARVAKKKAKTLNAARALIDSGVDPDVVARMMLQIPGEERYAPPTDKTSILDLTEALKNLDSIRSTKDNGNDQIMELIREMREEAKEQRTLLTRLLTEGSGGRGEKVDPMVAAKNQAEAMQALHTSMIQYAESLGWSRDGGKAVQRKSVEELKEENRHSEEMARLNTDKEYKTSLANSIGELPERIGMGIASQVQGNEGRGPAARDEVIEYFPCEKCGFKIPIPHGATTIHCPKCNETYNKGGAAPSQRQQPSPNVAQEPSAQQNIEIHVREPEETPEIGHHEVLV